MRPDVLSTRSIPETPTPIPYFQMRHLFLAATLLPATVLFASTEPLFEVEAYTFGQGDFQFTITATDHDFIFRFTESSGEIRLQAYKVEEVFAPEIWDFDVDSDDLIRWWYTGPDSVDIGDPPLEFSFLSSHTELLFPVESPSSLDFFQGIVVGSAVHRDPDQQGGGAGYHRFELDPVVIPEPAHAAGIFAGSTLLLALLLRIRRRRQ